jgi:hypothetical protein
MRTRDFYEQVYLDKELPKGGYIVFDNTVHSHQIQMVRNQYSGNVGGIIKRIGVVNMLYYACCDDKYYLLSYRIFDPDIDGKSKIDHVREIQQDCISYVGVLMDTYYAVSSLFQLINSSGKWLIISLICLCLTYLGQSISSHKGNTLKLKIWTYK